MKKLNFQIVTESPQPSRRTVPMNESGDFTFLPPLKDRQGESPVKQVQVHQGDSTHTAAAVAAIKAVPVPSQRQNFTKIEERRGNIAKETAIAAPTARKQSESERTPPSIENISLPQSKSSI